MSEGGWNGERRRGKEESGVSDMGGKGREKRRGKRGRRNAPRAV